jgi:hypothetical protein
VYLSSFDRPITQSNRAGLSQPDERRSWLVASDPLTRMSFEAYANLLVTLCAARESIRREVPLNSILTPTSMPRAHSLLDGHVLQTRTAKMKVTIPSKSNQPELAEFEYKSLDLATLEVAPGGAG